MIVYHGASDPVFSANDTLNWWDEVNTRENGNAAQVVRVFPVAGMNHCGGGPATDQFDAFSALVGWSTTPCAQENSMSFNISKSVRQVAHALSLLTLSWAPADACSLGAGFCGQCAQWLPATGFVRRGDVQIGEGAAGPARDLPPVRPTSQGGASDQPRPLQHRAAGWPRRRRWPGNEPRRERPVECDDAEARPSARSIFVACYRNR